MPVPAGRGATAARDEAAETSVKSASKSLRGRIQKGKISEYQVMLEIGFKLE